MRIRVNALEGLRNLKAEFCAWGPGVYEFPDDPRFTGWLQGYIDRGAVEVLSDTADTPVDPGDAAVPASGVDGEPRAVGAGPDPLAVGERVRYVTQNGKVQLHEIRGINADGTYQLNGNLKAIKRDRLAREEA